MLSHRPAQPSYRQAAEWLVEVRFAEPFDPEPLLTYIEQNPNWLQAGPVQIFAHRHSRA